MTNNEMDKLREELDGINLEILELVNKRAELVQTIGGIKGKQSTRRYDPVRERDMLDKIVEHNDGPFEDGKIKHIFKEIFKAGLDIQKDDRQKELLVSRKRKAEDTIIDINGAKFGNGEAHFITGPCAVESYEQVASVAKEVKDKGLKLLRGGAYKPRTSPYDFHGLGLEGLQILKRVADEFDLAMVSEIVSPQDIEEDVEYIDVIHIGIRNMQNNELLTTTGTVDKLD